MTKINSFPKTVRIHKKIDFSQVFSQGKKFRQPNMTGYFIRNNQPQSRLGVSIGRRFGKAHERNRFKRIIREVFRCHHKDQNISIDLVIIPNNKNKSLNFSILQQNFEVIWKQSQTILGKLPTNSKKGENKQ